MQEVLALLEKLRAVLRPRDQVHVNQDIEIATLNSIEVVVVVEGHAAVSRDEHVFVKAHIDNAPIDPEALLEHIIRQEFVPHRDQEPLGFVVIANFDLCSHKALLAH
jgi:hypothetical protein